MTSIAAVAPADRTQPAPLRNDNIALEQSVLKPPSTTTCLPRRASSDSLRFRFGNTKRNGSTGFLSGGNNESNGRTRGRTKSSDVDPFRSLPLVMEDYVPIKSCLSSKNLLMDGAEPESSIQKPPRKNVSFHTIEIREHERTLSDNPSVSSGPALGIGWSSIDSLQCTVAEWEEHRPPRRSKSHLAMPSQMREHILLNECHVSQDEINQTLRQTTRIKVSRNQASRDTEETRPPPRLLHAFAKFRKGSAESNAVDKQVELLLEQSLRAERIRQEQRQSYLQALEKQQRKEAARQTLERKVADETLNNTIVDNENDPNDDTDVMNVNMQAMNLTMTNPSSLSSNLSPFRNSDPTLPHEDAEEPWEF